QGLEVLPGGDALAVELEGFLVQGLQAQEHVVEPELAPELEELPVLDEHVAAGLEVILLLDAAPLELLSDGAPVLGMDEGDVVHEDHLGLADGGETLRRLLRRRLPIAPAVERPRAAERAVPRAAARQLGGGARIEDADEVLVPLAREIAGGEELVEVVEE